MVPFEYGAVCLSLVFLYLCASLLLNGSLVEETYSTTNSHPVFIFPHHDSDGSQNLFYVRRRTYLFTRSIEPRSIARHWRFRQENIH